MRTSKAPGKRVHGCLSSCPDHPWFRYLGLSACVVVGLAGSVQAQVAPAQPPTVPAPAESGAAPAAAEVDSPEKYAEIYVHRFFPADPRFALNATGEKRAEALAHFAEGFRKQSNKDMAGALKEFRRVLELDPTPVAMAAKVAGLEAVLGDPAEGEAVLKRSLEANPGNPGIAIAMAEYLRTFRKAEPGSKERSLQVLKDAFAAFPNSSPVVGQYLRFLLQDQKREEALAVLNEAQKNENASAAYYLTLGKMAAQILPVSRSKDSEPVALNAIFEKALAKAGDDPVIQDQVAAFYLATQQFAKAGALYQSLIAKHPDRLEFRQKLARVLGASGDATGAMKMLESIIDVDPDDVETRRELGRRYHESSKLARERGDMEQADADLGKALLHLQAALRTASGSVQEFNEVAQMLLQAKKPRDAAQLLERAAHLYPEDPIVGILQTYAYGASEEWTKSVPIFEKVIRLATLSQPALLDERFFFRFGAATERAGDVEGAAVLFRRSLELLTKSDPNLEDEENKAFAAQVYNYLGYMWVEKDQKIPESGELIKKALQLDPDSGAIMDSLGWYYFKAGEYQKAVDMLQKAARHMEESDGVVFDHIAQALFKLGRKEEALDHLRQALALEPENAQYKDRLEAFQKADPPTPPKPAAEPSSEAPAKPEKTDSPAPAPAK